MELLNALVNAAVVALVGLVLLWLGKERVDAFARAVDQRFDAVDQRFDAQDQRIDRLEQRLDHRIDRLEQRVGVLQGSVDAMRSDLTQVALAVGVGRSATNG